MFIPQIDYLDNQNVIGKGKLGKIVETTINSELFLDLMEHKTEGIFSLLEDESKQRAPSASNLMSTIFRVCPLKPAFAIPR